MTNIDLTELEIRTLQGMALSHMDHIANKMKSRRHANRKQLNLELEYLDTLVKKLSYTFVLSYLEDRLYTS